jgi:hypothetical protein
MGQTVAQAHVWLLLKKGELLLAVPEVYLDGGQKLRGKGTSAAKSYCPGRSSKT